MQLLWQQEDPADISWLNEFIDINELQHIVKNEKHPEHDHSLLLRWQEDGLSLVAPGTGNARPTQVDFLSPRLRHRVETSRKSAGLLKAVGLDKAREPLHVLDATAGLGIDAYTLAAKGCRVTLLEKHPVMAALLADGLRRALGSSDPQILARVARMVLVHRDAHDYLGQVRQFQVEDRPDVIYLDPMFPPRQKTARVKKDMALMQTLLPHNEDIDALLAAAGGVALKRVVLKRPGKAEKHSTMKPDFQVPGKACHFQVFLTG